MYMHKYPAECISPQCGLSAPCVLTLNLGLAAHQHAVIVVFLVIKGLNVLEDSQYLINIEIGVNFVVIIVYKVGDLYTP